MERPNTLGRLGEDAPDMTVVGIDFNPGPDAKERVRRLFTILFKLAEDDLPVPMIHSLQH